MARRGNGGKKFQVMGALSPEEYAALKAGIAENGVEVPVVLDAEGEIIDGHHRVRAWTELRDEGRELADYPREVRSDLKTNAEKRELAWRLNMQRRNLNRAQKRALIAAKLKETPEWSDNRIAKLLGVSWHTVSEVRKELEATSQIAKLERLIGSDHKERPRSDARTEEEKAELRESWRQVEEHKKTLRLAETIQRNPERTDEDLAEQTGAEPATVGELRELLERTAQKKGFDLVSRGLASLRSAAGYRRRPNPLDEFLKGIFGPRRVEVQPVVDLDAIANELAGKYVEREGLQRHFHEWAVEQVREKVKADREAADLLAEFVATLERAVEKRIELLERFPEDRARLEEDLRRMEEEGEVGG